MTTEPRRSQYLEAMGLTAWISRYRLPNAALTPACEWLESEVMPAQPPAQRLHALLDDAEQLPVSSVAHPTNPAPARPSPARHGASQAKRARALLEAEGIAVEPDTDIDSSATVIDNPNPTANSALSSATAVSLRFTLQIAALDGRWLILLPDIHDPNATAQRLLMNLLHAARIVPGAAPSFQTFRWPMMEGQPVEAPLDEARDGLRAFVEGRRRRGWRPEKLLVFGQDETLAPVLELENDHCRLLGIPGWQGPSLQELAQSAVAKRELWPYLCSWQDAWHRAADGDGEQAPGDNDAAS